MTQKNYDDVVRQLESAGFLLDQPLNTDARIQRWKVDGEGHEKRGWSRLKEWKSKYGEYYLVGHYGVWHGNHDGRIEVDLRFGDHESALDVEEKRAIREAHKVAVKEIEKTRKVEAKRAGDWAASVWHLCTAATEHEYCTRKHIKVDGLRVLGDLVATSGSGRHETINGLALDGIDQSNLYRLKAAAGALVVPMHDVKGNIAGLQFIYGWAHPRKKKIERDKEFWPAGMAMGGTFGLLGPMYGNGILLVCEGRATASTLYEATGYSVAYAFSANNLIKAGRDIRKAYPRMRILFCADDDYLSEGNPGTAEAAKATAAIEHAAWVAPDFRDDHGVDRRDGKKLTDFNDLAALDGVGLGVAKQIADKLAALNWHELRVTPPSGAVDTQSGQGGERQPLKSLITIDEGADRFALVYGGKGTLFDFEEHALIPKADVLDILPDRAWSDLKKHPRWRAVRLVEVGFDPAGTDTSITCNLFGGWPTTAKEGNCQALLDLLEFLCLGEKNAKEIFEWVLKWLAYPLQHPGAKMRTALIFHGPQGAGKNLFFEAVMAIYGEYGRIVDQVAIESPFNDWASRKLFLIADEVVARQELFHVKNKLKHFVTGEWIRINPKNVTPHDEKNHVNIVYLSNEHQPLVLEKDDRRHIVIWTPPTDSPDFYAAVRDEINAGGIAALHHYLLQLPLGDFSEHTKPPMTEAKRDLIEVSLGSIERFVDEWKASELGYPLCPCAGSDLYLAYLKWCKAQGITKPREQNQFVNSVAKQPGWDRGLKDRYDTLHYTGTAKRQRFVLPSLDAMTEAAKEGHEDHRKKDTQTQAQWLTDCYFAFHNALSANERPEPPPL